MKYSVLIAISLLIGSFCVTAQSQAGYTIKGRVIDSKSRQGVEFFNVALYDQNNSKSLVQGTITTTKGGFTIDKVKAGNYILGVSFIGYTTLERKIEVVGPDKEIKIGTIVVSEDSKLLETVEIVGQKGQMSMDLDKRVFNVDQNILGSVTSVSDLLKNVPSVEVDIEGNVSLRSSANVTVWINGRPSGLDEENRAQILEQMPAESIEKIEIITNPSSKYSPEGSAGIINLVLKKDRKAGYYGSVTAGANTLGGYQASGNINYNSSNIDAYANIGVGGHRFTSGGNTERTSWVGADTTQLNQQEEGTSGGMGVFSRLGMTWHINKDHDLGANAMFMWGNNNRTNNTDYQQYALKIPLDTTLWSRSNGSEFKRMHWNTTIEYDGRIGGRSDHTLRGSLSYSGSTRQSVGDYTERYTNKPIADILQQQISGGDNHGLELQADYSNQLNKMFKVEFGYKGTGSMRLSTAETYNDFQKQNIDINLFNNFDYYETIHALYGTFSGAIEKFTFQVGLRGEYTAMSTSTSDFKLEQGSPIVQVPVVYTNDYFKLFPTVFLTYGFAHDNDLQLSLTRRINRPRGRMLNSFVNVADSRNWSFGNPQLLPEMSWATELNYMKRFESHTLSASLYYRYNENVIQSVRFMEPHTVNGANVDIMMTTYGNLTQSQRAGAELMAKNRLWNMLDLTTTVNLYYYKIDGFTYRETDYAYSENFAWDARIIANLMLPKQWGIQVNARYRSPQIEAQGTSSESYSLDLGLRKSFLNRSLNVSLTGRDLLNSHFHANERTGSSFIESSYRYFNARSVQLTLTYSFGNMKAKRDKKGMDRGSSNTESEYDSMGGDF